MLNLNKVKIKHVIKENGLSLSHFTAEVISVFQCFAAECSLIQGHTNKFFTYRALFLATVCLLVLYSSHSSENTLRLSQSHCIKYTYAEYTVMYIICRKISQTVTNRSAAFEPFIVFTVAVTHCLEE